MASAIAVPSAAMQRRIASHLENGITPSVRGNRAMLKDVVLIKANGERAPAAAEAERQATALGINLDMSFWNTNRATDPRGNQIFAFDRSGQGHTIVRKYRGERVVTKAGRRFYNESPQTQWIVHLPAILRRQLADGSSSCSKPQTVDINMKFMLEMFEPQQPWYHLLDAIRTRDGADAQQQVQHMKREWSAAFQQRGLQFQTLGLTPAGLIRMLRLKSTHHSLRFRYSYMACQEADNAPWTRFSPSCVRCTSHWV